MRGAVLPDSGKVYGNTPAEAGCRARPRTISIAQAGRIVNPPVPVTVCPGNCSRLRGRKGSQPKFRTWLPLHKRPNSPQIPASLNSYLSRSPGPFQSRRCHCERSAAISDRWRVFVTKIGELNEFAMLQRSRNDFGKTRGNCGTRRPSALRLKAAPNQGVGWTGAPPRR